MKVSVIIPTRNRAALLKRCLNSLRNQTLDTGSFEIIVVDNGSSDNTPQVVDEFKSFFNIKYFFDDEPGLHVGRHTGMRHAESENLTFADDDIEALPSWLEAIASGFDDERVTIIGGNNYPNFESLPPEWLVDLWNDTVGPGRAVGMLSILDFGTGKFHIDPNYVWGCNFSVRRSAVEAAGGFHPDALPHELLKYRGDGESYISRHIKMNGGLALFDSSASVFHFVPTDRMTKDYFLKRHFAQGVSDSYTAVRSSCDVLTWRSEIRSYLRIYYWRAKAFWRLLKAFWKRPAWARWLLEWESAGAYRDGREFHRHAVAVEPELLLWIRRDNYFNTTLKNILSAKGPK